MKLFGKVSSLFIIITLFSSQAFADCRRWDAIRNVCTIQNASRCPAPAEDTCCTDLNQCAAVLPPDQTQFSEMVESFNEAVQLEPAVTTVPGIINTLTRYAIGLAGVVLFAMLVFGGFTMLTAATSPESADKGKKMITAALAGFMVIVVAYWIIQALEIILGIQVLS